MSVSTADAPVRKSVLVDATPEEAFRVFTQEAAGWWPIASHSLLDGEATSLVFEEAAGGRVYERAPDGRQADWGRVLAWEPPRRVVLTWELSADFRPDPGVRTEVEVRFSPDGAHRTRVDLEHRGLEAYGERAGEMRETYGSDGGWAGLLRAFAATADGEA